MSTLLLKNIGTIVSGDITNPLLDGDAVYVEDGKIAKIGTTDQLSALQCDRVVDCKGTTLIPGLIDSHCHTILGDYTSRQNQIGFLESELHGGVTTIISAGEVHLKGRPKDPAGTKALAILAAKSFQNYRPGGAKVIGGSVILEKGLQKQDFEEMAKEGVRTVGEIGLGSVKDPAEAKPMVEWAKEYGMTVMMHTGGTSIPGSSTITAKMVQDTGPHIASHVNGGPTSVSYEEVQKLVRESEVVLEIVHCGNPLMACKAAELCLTEGALHRVIIGNDAPSGTGVIPLGILRVINHLASLTAVKAEQAIAMATGNTAKVHKLDTGRIEVGKSADLVLIDSPMGSVGDDALSAIEVGDLPGVSMIFVDGELVVGKSRNTPPVKRMPVFVE